MTFETLISRIWNRLLWGKAKPSATSGMGFVFPIIRRDFNRPPISPTPIADKTGLCPCQTGEWRDYGMERLIRALTPPLRHNRDYHSIARKGFLLVDPLDDYK